MKSSSFFPVFYLSDIILAIVSSIVFAITNVFVFGIIALCSAIIFGLCLSISLIFPKARHYMFSYHVPDGRYEQKGILTISHCKYCGKEICEDSQGNWFEI